MNSIKKLLIPLLLLAVLILALVVVYMSKYAKMAPEEVTSDYELMLVSSDNVSKLTIMRGTKNDLYISKVDDKWNVEGGISGLEFSDKAITEYLDDLLSIYAVGYIDLESPDPGDYGLSDNFSYIIKVETLDGTTKTLKIGDSSVDKMNCFASTDNNSNIFIIDNRYKTLCDYDPVDFYSSVKVTVDYSQVDNIVIDRTSKNDSFTFIPVSHDDGYSFEFVSPLSVDCGDALNSFFTSFEDLNITSFAALSDEEKTKVGLDDPAYSIYFNMKDGSRKTVYLSELKNDMCYGYGSICKTEFILGTRQVGAVTLPFEQMVSEYIRQFTPPEVKKIDCFRNDTEFTLEIDAEDTLSTQTASVLLDGRDAQIFSSNGTCYANVLFYALSQIRIGGIELDAVPAGKAEIEIKIFDSDYVNTKMSFIKRDSQSYYYMLNDEYTGLYVYSNEFFKDGGLVLDDYGVFPAYDLLTTAINDNLNYIYEMPTEEQ